MEHTCITCGDAFTISPEEDALREKIGSLMKVVFPATHLCIPCRTMRLMSWRNERVLYKRICDKTGKEIISVFPAGTTFPVYERTAWYGDGWDAVTFGRDVDFGKPVFDQLKELQAVVPRPALNGKNTENCDYCNFAFETRNCYLSHCAYNSESLSYCYWMLECRDCTNCSFCFHCERCIECTDCNESYNCHGCVLCTNCADSNFLYDCRGCTDCFGCVGLRKRTYSIFNEQLTKEEYLARIQEFDLQNPQHLQAVRERVRSLALQHPHRYSIQEKCEDCTGDFLVENKHCLHCYQVFRSEDCINSPDSEGSKDMLDSYHCGWSEMVYNAYSPVRLKGCAVTTQCWDGNDLLYCDNCQNCSDCIGCIGLQHKRFCILNKQYTEIDYREMLPKVIAHMEQTGEWGEFYPPSLSPFAYNESVAPEFRNLSQAEAEKQGWRWQTDLPFTTGKETVTWDNVPARIEDTPDSMVKEIVACEKCSRNFRIIQQELTFYRDKGLPLPHHCPDCRHLERVGLRNPRTLYDRACDKCGKGMETTYAPDRPEKVFCEECYLKTVY
jgi:hypothetical protein